MSDLVIPPNWAERAVRWLQQHSANRHASKPKVSNPFLEGVYAPVSHESTDSSPAVVGQLPTELNGLYVRIGPNPLTPPHPAHYHWFMGDGMVHGVRLRDGQALWYRSRWVGTDSAQTTLGRPLAPGRRRGVSDVVNTNVFGHAGRVWAATEAGVLPVEMDGELNTLRHGLLHSAASSPYSAHPHLDPTTGDLHAVCYDALTPWRVRYVRANAAGQVDRSIDIPVRHGPMVHDCAITRSQVIVLDLPVTFSWRQALGVGAFPYAWNDRHPARVGLLPRSARSARDIRWLSVDPCYVFHACNAFDLPDGSVVLDVVAHARMFDRSRVGPELDGQPRFERWTLPAQGESVRREVINDHPQEFPRLDERKTGQPYRYAYAVDVRSDVDHSRPLLKHDLHTGQTTRHDFGPHLTPGEMVFVPRSADSAEDDGWLIGWVHNGHTQCGELHVLNASDISAPAQAIVQVSARVPAGFHGNWIVEDHLS